MRQLPCKREAQTKRCSPPTSRRSRAALPGRSLAVCACLLMSCHQPEESSSSPVAEKSPSAEAVASKPEAPDLKAAPSGINVIRGQCFKVGDFYLGGQPARPQYAVARDKGVKTVVNVRMDRELDGLGFDPGYAVEELNLTYHHIPISPEDIDVATAEKFLEILRTSEKPLLLHGSNGNRVWGLWALYVGAEYGIPVDETKKQASELGIKKLVIEDFVRDYLKREGSDG